MTQNEKLIQHMREVGSISQREAMREYDIQSFTKRISEIRRAGVKVLSKVKTNPITGQRYSRYYIPA